MYNLELTQVINSSQNVSSNHFGGNVLAEGETTDGVLNTENQLAHHELDISVTRYGAGQPDAIFRDGMLIDGNLPDHLVNYLTTARANGQSVVIVTPTYESYHGADVLTPFTTLVMEQFSDVVHAFEIGNEYWNYQTETVYGEIANDSVLAISAGLIEANIDVPIWVQMGSAGGQASEYANDTALSEGVGWIWRNVGANNLILDQLSIEARAVIDGVVEHYYFRDTGQYQNGLYNDQNIILDHEIWESSFGRDLTLNITEWNIRITNLDQLGIRAASTLLAQFSFMMDMEVDEAYVWPPMHNTATDLAGSQYVLLDAGTGVVINSVGGATFDLMSSSLVGLEYLPSATTNNTSLIDEYVYADEERVVVYITSRSNETEDVSFSLGNFFNDASLTSAIQIGYDRSSSDGMHWSSVEQSFVEANSIMVDGEVYYINEHDVNATIISHDITQSTLGVDYTFTLLPYEVIELTYELPTFVRIEGSSGSDIIVGEASSDDLIYSWSGEDSIQTGSGEDTIYAGSDNDYVDSGLEDDLIYGGNGDDILRGGGNNDTIFGEDGDDEIRGGLGHDQLSGGSGSDLLAGGWGNDTIISDDGSDIVIGGYGDDVFQFDTPQTYLAGWGGLNVSNQYQVGTGSFVSVTGYNSYSNVVLGGEGHDILEFSSSNDAIFLHNDFADVHIDLLGSEYSENLSTSSIFSGIEEIRAGAGNDLVDLTSSTSSLIGEEITIHGNQGDDVIWGSAANETIYGGEGDDTLFGGAGSDTLYGGEGADVFEFSSTSFGTSILDYDVQSGDRIRVYQTEDFQFSTLALNENSISLIFQSDREIQIDLPYNSANNLSFAEYLESIDIL